MTNTTINIALLLGSIAFATPFAANALTPNSGAALILADASMDHSKMKAGKMDHSQMTPWVSGKVVRVSTKRGKITIAHDAIPNLGMGAMTMAFKVADAAMLKSLSVGDMIEFKASQHDGLLMVDSVRNAAD